MYDSQFNTEILWEIKCTNLLQNTFFFLLSLVFHFRNVSFGLPEVICQHCLATFALLNTLRTTMSWWYRSSCSLRSKLKLMGKTSMCEQSLCSVCWTLYPIFSYTVISSSTSRWKFWFSLFFRNTSLSLSFNNLSDSLSFWSGLIYGPVDFPSLIFPVVFLWNNSLKYINVPPILCRDFKNYLNTPTFICRAGRITLSVSMERL